MLLDDGMMWPPMWVVVVMLLFILPTIQNPGISEDFSQDFIVAMVEWLALSVSLGGLGFEPGEILWLVTIGTIIYRLNPGGMSGWLERLYLALQHTTKSIGRSLTEANHSLVNIDNELQKIQKRSI